MRKEINRTVGGVKCTSILSTLIFLMHYFAVLSTNFINCKDISSVPNLSRCKYHSVCVCTCVCVCVCVCVYIYIPFVSFNTQKIEQ
jgi:hypothetical protein